MFDWLQTNGEKLSIISLLLGGFTVFLTAWKKEWFILGDTHRRMMADKDGEIARLRVDVDTAQARSERLLSQLERTVQVAEDVSSIAAVSSIRRTDPPSERRR